MSTNDLNNGDLVILEKPANDFHLGIVTEVGVADYRIFYFKDGIQKGGRIAPENKGKQRGWWLYSESKDEFTATAVIPGQGKVEISITSDPDTTLGKESYTVDAMINGSPQTIDFKDIHFTPKDGSKRAREESSSTASSSRQKRSDASLSPAPAAAVTTPSPSNQPTTPNGASTALSVPSTTASPNSTATDATVADGGDLGEVGAGEDESGRRHRRHPLPLLPQLPTSDAPSAYSTAPTYPTSDAPSAYSTNPSYPTSDAHSTCSTTPTYPTSALIDPEKKDRFDYLFANGVNKKTVTPVIDLMKDQEILTYDTLRESLKTLYNQIAEYSPTHKNLAKLKASLVINPDNDILASILALLRKKQELSRSLAQPDSEQKAALMLLMHWEGVRVLLILVQVTPASTAVNYSYLPAKSKRMYHDNGTIVPCPSGCNIEVVGIFNAIMESTDPRIRASGLPIAAQTAQRSNACSHPQSTLPTTPFPKGFLRNGRRASPMLSRPRMGWITLFDLVSRKPEKPASMRVTIQSVTGSGSARTRAPTKLQKAKGTQSPSSPVRLRHTLL